MGRREFGDSVAQRRLVDTGVGRDMSNEPDIGSTVLKQRVSQGSRRVACSCCCSYRVARLRVGCSGEQRADRSNINAHDHGGSDLGHAQ